MKFDNEYFSTLVEESATVGIDAEQEMKEQEEVLMDASTESLNKLMNASPEEFYPRLMDALDSARIKHIYDKKLFKKASTLKKTIEDGLDKTPKLIVWIYKSIKFVCAKILGFIKFTLDFVVDTTAYVCRSGKAVFIKDETIGKKDKLKSEAKNYFKSVCSTFKKHVL